MHVAVYIVLTCRPITIEHGLFDQIRVDHGREWYLLLAVQKQLSALRLHQDRAPYLQTTSTMVWMYTMCVLSQQVNSEPCVLYCYC